MFALWSCLAELCGGALCLHCGAAWLSCVVELYVGTVELLGLAVCVVEVCADSVVEVCVD